MSSVQCSLRRLGPVLLLGLFLMTGCSLNSNGSHRPKYPPCYCQHSPPGVLCGPHWGAMPLWSKRWSLPGRNLNTYEPKPEQLKAISQADAYLRIRVDFEDAWMDRLLAANPQMQVIDTTQGIERLPLPAGLEEGMTPGSTEGQG